MKRVCSICGKEFEPNRSFQKYCSKECRRQGHILTNREYRQKHKEETKTCRKQYYLEHKEQIKAYRKQYYQKNKERIKAYQRMMEKTNNPEIAKCCSTHNNCFECPTLDGECLYD